MTRPALEVGDIFREYGSAYLEAYGDVTSPQQRRVLHDLVRCRTAALGGHVEECERCGQRRVAYNSCRNRHCPRCQGGARAAWLEREASYLLPVEYFHLVFTLPEGLGPLALQNQRVLYGTLFRATAEALQQIAADPRHLGAGIGFVAVLHTWGQSLHLHPHLHCIVPGGGLDPGGTRWVPCRPGFFLPVRVLGRLFRGKFLALLAGAFRQGRLAFRGRLEHLADATAFGHLIDELRQRDWVVYAKPPVGGPAQVLKYLAGYTHRVAISNQRLLELEGGRVHFRWKGYAHGNASKVMTLDAVEFIRRFLLHVLPGGLVRIRHYGLLANRHRDEKLELCRRLLGDKGQTPIEPVVTAKGEKAEGEKAAGERCPVCHEGRMVTVEVLPPQRQQAREEEAARLRTVDDTS